MEKKGTIARIWRGWTTPSNAETFERILREEAIPAITQNRPAGLRGIQLLKRSVGLEVEFTTIMWFQDLASVIEFAGPAYQKAHIDPSVQPLLVRFDEQSAHHSICFDLE
jgi:hypothetical protein